MRLTALPSTRPPARATGHLHVSRVTPGIATSDLGGAASHVYSVGESVSREFIAWSHVTTWPVYAAIENAELPIFFHNVDPFSQRMLEKDYSMINVLGNPFEATIAGALGMPMPWVTARPDRGRTCAS